MFQLVCQAVLAIVFSAQFLAMVHMDFHGRKAQEPKQFQGFITSVVVSLLMFFLAWGAGAFSRLT